LETEVNLAFPVDSQCFPRAWWDTCEGLATERLQLRWEGCSISSSFKFTKGYFSHLYSLRQFG